MCIERFSIFSQLQEELESARTALSDRKLIDRAKGILMAKKNVSEDEAYAALRKAAMDGQKRIGDVARALIAAEEKEEGKGP